MRPGFEFVLTPSGEGKFQLFSPQPSWVSFAQDSETGNTAALMGKLYYQSDFKTRFPTLRQHHFSTDADWVLAAYQHQGVESLQHLEGEFALVIFDAVRQCLFALRDPLGNYPLYASNGPRPIRVSTNLQRLARQQSAAINRDFLASFLMFPFAFVELATEQTAFEGIKRILPGNLVELSANHPPKIRWTWNWEAKIQPIASLTGQEAGSQFRQIFQQAIQERLSNETVAAHLSGGMDSSSIVCLAQNLLQGKPLTTLSLVYQLRSLAGETAYIQAVIDQSQALAPHFVEGDAALDFQWFTADLPEHDEPHPGLFHLAMERALTQSASQLGITVVLSGNGAESVVEGNRYYLADLLRQGQWQQTLQLARQGARAKNESLWSVLSKWAIAPLIPPLLQQGIEPLFKQGYGTWPKLSHFEIPPWILVDFARDRQLWHKALTTMGQLQQYPIEQAFNRLGLQSATGNWSAWYLAAPLGIRISQPFLDPRVIAYCFSLPRELREVPGKPKPLLQSAMAGILPEPIRTRRIKANFNEIYCQGLGQNLSRLEEMVNRSQIDDLGIFDKSQLIAVMRQQALGIGDARSGSRMSSSLAVIAWFDRLTQGDE